MEVYSLSRSSRGRVGVGVLPQNALVERIDFPPTRRALSSAIAEAQLRRSILDGRRRRPMLPRKRERWTESVDTPIQPKIIPL